MSDEENKKMLEIDARDAAYRLAGRQLVKTTRDPLVAFLSKQMSPEDPSAIAPRIAAFLDTELGEALVAALIGMGITYFPAALGDHANRLAKELRVKSMTDVGDVVADLFMEPLRHVITNFIVRPSPDPLSLPQEAVGRTRVEVAVEIPQEAKVKA